MSPVSLVRDGRVDDLHFRKFKGMWTPDHHVYNFYVGKERWGFVTQSSAWKDKWDAWSFSRNCPKSLHQCGGFATRLDAGRFIVKTYGYWENS